MKLINKLDALNETSIYSGQQTKITEMYLRPSPTEDENGVKLKPAQRYYVFRFLFFTSKDRTNYPFIVRNEHEFFKTDASGKVLSVNRICCPTTPWAKSKLNEEVGRDYCPICKMSFDQKSEGWKNYHTTKQIDRTCLDLSNKMSRKWAAYLPVFVVSDPVYNRNNNHLRVLRLAGDEGQSTLGKIRDIIHQANESGVTIFNGGEGANVAILCESVTKVMLNKKGEPVIDQSTGKPRTYKANCVTDVRLLSNRLHAYPQITESAIEELKFDETYGVPATRDQLSIFMSENYLDNGASDSDFGMDDLDDDFSAPIMAEPKPPKAVETVVTSEAIVTEVNTDGTVDGFSDDFGLEEDTETPNQTIARLTKNTKMVTPTKVEFPPDSDSLREKSVDFSDISDDDLPF